MIVTVAVEILVGVWYFSRGILGLARGAMFPAHC